MKLLETLYRTVISLFTSSGPLTCYAIFCTIILCVLFQIFFLRRIAIKSEVKLSAPHFVGVYIFLIYIAFVFILTGFGTIWDIIYYGDIGRVADIHLMPFDTFEIEYASSNIISYTLNIIMMVPFGFMLALIWPNFRSLKKIALVAFAFALSIEISQLFNLRASTVDDLIMNTLGAIVGYLVFKGFYRLTAKNKDNYNEQKREVKHSSKVLRNEAIIYLICSVIGMFLFFNALMQIGKSDFSDDVENLASRNGFVETDGAENTPSVGSSLVTDNTVNIPSEDVFLEIEYEYTNGHVIEVREKSVIIELIKFVAPDGGEMILDPGSVVEVAIDKNTIYEISKSDNFGAAVPVISEATKDDLEIGDMVDFYLKEVNDAIAEKIVILRLDG